MVERHDVRQGRGNRVYESKGLPGAAAMVARYDVRQGRGNRVYESKGLLGAAAMVARYVVRLVRQGDTAASSQRVCRNAPPQKGL